MIFNFCFSVRICHCFTGFTLQSFCFSTEVGFCIYVLGQYFLNVTWGVKYRGQILGQKRRQISGILRKGVKKRVKFREYLKRGQISGSNCAVKFRGQKRGQISGIHKKGVKLWGQIVGSKRESNFGDTFLDQMFAKIVAFLPQFCTPKILFFYINILLFRHQTFCVFKPIFYTKFWTKWCKKLV